MTQNDKYTSLERAHKPPPRHTEFSTVSLPASGRYIIIAKSSRTASAVTGLSIFLSFIKAINHWTIHKSDPNPTVAFSLTRWYAFEHVRTSSTTLECVRTRDGLKILASLDFSSVLADAVSRGPSLSTVVNGVRTPLTTFERRRRCWRHQWERYLTIYDKISSEQWQIRRE